MKANSRPQLWRGWSPGTGGLGRVSKGVVRDMGGAAWGGDCKVMRAAPAGEAIRPTVA
jgi:hypothetical protein